MTPALPTARPSLGKKFFGVAALTLALGLPLLAVFLLIFDRQGTADQVRRDIASAWAGPQTLRGPYLVIPFRATGTQTITENNQARTIQVTTEEALIIAPEELAVTADLKPEVRTRSLFDVIVFQGPVELKGRYRLPDLKPLDLSWDRLMVDRAYLLLAIDDAKGMGGVTPDVVLDGQRIRLEPGSRALTMVGASVNGSVDASALPTRDLSFTGKLMLKGSTQFSVETVARSLRVSITSPWASPSFTGGVLPETRQVTPQGFSATWR
jgi:inner membrane protein